MYFVKGTGKRDQFHVAKCTLVLLLLVQDFQASTGLLYIVRQTCTRGTVFTPAPATTSNICLQCVCVMSNISYCKTLIVQLSVVCSAALVVPAAATTAAPTTTTIRPAVTIPTIPTIPTVATIAPTTSVGINPRASSPAVSAMIVPTAPALMIGSPMMMMMMTAAGTAAGMSMTAAGATSMTPMAAG